MRPLVHLLRFARRFVPLERSPRTQYALPGYPEILLLSNIVNAHGQPIGMPRRASPGIPISYTASCLPKYFVSRLNSNLLVHMQYRRQLRKAVGGLRGMNTA